MRNTATERRPDFSGVWRADLERSRLEIEAPDATIIRIEHEDPSFLLTRTHQAGAVSDTLSLSLSTDGSECVADREGTSIRSRCEWRGSSLRFHSILRRGEVAATNLVVYTMSSDGREIRADERYEGPPRSYHNRWVLVRETRGGGDAGAPSGGGEPAGAGARPPRGER